MVKRKAIWNALRMKILVRDQFKCQYCGLTVKDNAVLQVDHIVPVSKGGTNDEYNLITSCRDCNMWKFDHNIEELEAIRLETAKWKLKELNEVVKKKEELEKIASAIIEIKAGINYTPELMALITYADKNKYTIDKKDYKNLESLIKKYGVSSVIDWLNVCSNKKKITASYLNWVRKNIELNTKYPRWSLQYRECKIKFIDRLYLKYPISEETKEIIMGFYENHEFEYTDPDYYQLVFAINKIFKRSWNYKLIDQLVEDAVALSDPWDILRLAVSISNGLDVSDQANIWNKWSSYLINDDLLDKIPDELLNKRIYNKKIYKVEDNNKTLYYLDTYKK